MSIAANGLWVVFACSPAWSMSSSIQCGPEIAEPPETSSQISIRERLTPEFDIQPAIEKQLS